MTVGSLPNPVTSSPAAETARKVRPARRDGRRLADRFSFRANLLAGIGALVVLTGAATTLIAGRSYRAATSSLAGGLFRETSEHAVTHARAFVERAGPLVESLARLGDDSLALGDSDRLARQLAAVLPANPGIS